MRPDYVPPQASAPAPPPSPVDAGPLAANPQTRQTQQRPARHDGSPREWLVNAITRGATRYIASAVSVVVVATGLTGCQWRGLNSLPMPGTAGGGQGSYEITAQMPDVAYVQPNSRVRVGDANVGTVTKIEA